MPAHSCSYTIYAPISSSIRVIECWSSEIIKRIRTLCIEWNLQPRHTIITLCIKLAHNSVWTGDLHCMTWNDQQKSLAFRIKKFRARQRYAFCIEIESWIENPVFYTPCRFFCVHLRNAPTVIIIWNKQKPAGFWKRKDILLILMLCLLFRLWDVILFDVPVCSVR